MAVIDSNECTYEIPAFANKETKAWPSQAPAPWVGSDFVRSFIDMLVYEREEDDALVIGAGIPEAWLEKGVRVQGLRTNYGPVDFSARRDGRRVVVTISGVRVPRGGVVLMLPGVSERVVRHVPATIWLQR